MNSLLLWLTSPEWAVVVKTLVHSLWQGSLIAAVLALVLRRIERPAFRYRLALAGLVAIVLSAIVTWSVLSAPEPRPTAELPPAAAPRFLAPAQSKPTEIIVVTAERNPVSQSIQWTAWIALAWLVGTSAMLGRASVKVAGAERLRRGCQSINDPRITDLVNEARRAVQLTRPVRIAVTQQLTSPAVVGILVPTLILPLSLMTTLSHEQIRFILLHELAHIRRGDYLANLIQLFAEALFFFNPAVWWISHQVRREREACCDALAIELSGAPADYARTLVSVAETMLNPSPAAAPAFGNDREPSSLSDRVQRLLVPGYRPSLRLTWRAMLATLALGGLALTVLAISARETVAAALGVESSEAARVLDASAVDFPYREVGLKQDFLLIEEAALRQFLPEAMNANRPWVLEATELARVQSLLLRSGAKPFCSAEPMYGQIVSGMDCLWRMGNAWTNNTINYLTAPLVDQGITNTRVVGMEATFAADVPGWTAMEFGVRPLLRAGQIECDLRMKVGSATHQTTTTIPPGGGLVWATPQGSTGQGLRQLVVLRNEPSPSEASTIGSPAGADQNTPDERVQTYSGRREIVRVLSAVVFESIAFDHTPLGEVLLMLNRECGRLDPAGRGVLFVLKSPTEFPEQGSLSEVEVTIQPALEKVNLADLLDAVVTRAQSPIQYSIGETAIEFSPAPSPVQPQLVTRTYKVDANQMAQALEQNLPEAATNTALALREFVTRLGVTLNPPKAMFYNERNGGVFIRATKEDLEIIDQALQVLNQQPAQVNIRAKFVELPFDQAAQVLEDLRLTNQTPATFTGILTESQAKWLFKTLETMKGVDILSAPEVTTLSGRQAQMQVVDINTVVTGVTSIVTNGVTTNQLDTTAMPFGPVLDIVPSVADDGYTVHMTIIPTVTAFLGYEKPDPALKEAAARRGIDAPLPLPRWRNRQLSTSVSVWDGQTVVLGGFISETVTRQLDGTETRESTPGLDKKQLLVFVTPTVIDQAGNRRNAEPPK